MYMKIIEFENVEFLFKPVHLQQIFVRYSSKNNSTILKISEYLLNISWPHIIFMIINRSTLFV